MAVDPNTIILGPRTADNTSIPLSDPSALKPPTARQFSGLSAVKQPQDLTPRATTGWGNAGTWAH